MKVTIDGQTIEVEPGTTILQAARMMEAIRFLLQCAIIQNLKTQEEIVVLVW